MPTHEKLPIPEHEALLAQVHRKLFFNFGSPSEQRALSRVDAAFRHHFSARGQQTRPRLTIAASRALGLDDRVAIGFATCIEALHNASLVQDDLQDGALERRGHPSVHSLFGKDVALGLATRLVSSGFLSLASIRLDGILSGEIARRVQQAISETIDGQCHDLDPQAHRSVQDLLRSARQKSGPLFALTLELPLIASGFDAPAVMAREAACKLGLGYQIFDDLKDQSIDRLQPADANIVNALAEMMPATEARHEAIAMASTELTEASRLADQLPADCGAQLRTLAEELLTRLRAFRG